ncbi:hypothetical protein F164LOC_20770 [Pectobacterium carotovorum]|uniref:hypothetical protein n=1 Tax=Pectobacterium versatile TaxID=2488639 RepID=UPI000C7EFEC5|nr:hypothetical protein [Pectobacterium versatile]PLY35372.1 hypothetical protein F164LOC_20770 [Pectobacterium carotovorum]
MMDEKEKREPVYIVYCNSGLRSERGAFDLNKILSGQRIGYIYCAKNQYFADKWMRQYSFNRRIEHTVAGIITEQQAMIIEPDKKEHIMVDSEDYFKGKKHAGR